MMTLEAKAGRFSRWHTIRPTAADAAHSKCPTIWHAAIIVIPFVITGAPRAHAQDCEVFCDGFQLGICPGGGVGCPETAAECLVFCTGTDGGLGCECGALTDCLFGGVSIVETPVCGNGLHEGTEECDPGVDPLGDADCACTGQCQGDCTCPGPGAVCGNNVREGTEQCDGTDDAACPGLCQADCTCAGEPIPTVSEWGMVVLMLSLLVGTKLRFGRRPLEESK